MSLISLSTRMGGSRRGLAATAAGSLIGALTLVAAPLTVGAADAAPAKDRPAPVIGTERASAIDGRYVVVLEGRASTAQDGNAIDVARDNGASDVDRFSTAIEGFSAKLSDSAVDALRTNPNVAFIEADQRVAIDATQSPATWGLDRIDQRNLPLNNSYTYTPTGQGVTAYIIDTGVLGTHNEFAGRVAAGYTAINDGRGTTDCNGHGTHVAGTVGGTTYGVAKQVTIRPVRVLDCTGSGTTSGVIAGVDWVTVEPRRRCPRGRQHEPRWRRLLGARHRGQQLDRRRRHLRGRGRQREHQRLQRLALARRSGADRRFHHEHRRPFELLELRLLPRHLRAGLQHHLGLVHRRRRRPTPSPARRWPLPHVAGVAALYLQGNPSASPATVGNAITSTATTGVVSGAQTGSPNRLLYSPLTGGGTTPPPTGNLLANPGFESGATSWSATSGVITTDTGAPTRTGSWKAWLNGYGQTTTDTLSQSVTIPAASSATLSFWLYVSSAETTTSTAYDRLSVQVVSGGSTTTLGTFSNLNKGSSYVQRSFNMSSFAGRTVTLRFTGTEDASLATSFVIDDTSLTTG